MRDNYVMICGTLIISIAPGSWEWMFCLPLYCIAYLLIPDNDYDPV